MEWVEMVEFIYAWGTRLMAPRRWLLCLGAFILFGIGWWHGGDDSDTSSTAGSQSSGDGEISGTALAVAVEPIELM
eukprot:15623591-Heterocapsa_arctica.AAC.1